MKTPKEYNDNLKNKVITSEMLGTSLYSVNKRAKNCRDKKRNYRYSYYDYGSKYEEQEQEYYRIKDQLLMLCKPACIHKQPITKRERIYSYEEEFYKLDESQVIYENEYYDRDTHEVIEFKDIYVTEYLYFLYYKVNEYSFHTPIYTIDSFKDLEIKEIEELVTFGRNTQDLLSVQFVKKVLALIESGEYKLIA